MSERILVVIPAFNAEKSVGEIVRGCREFLSDVVVVNDGSSDQTATAATAAGAALVSHSRNRGKGAALKSGFAWALQHGYDAVITQRSDRKSVV